MLGVDVAGGGEDGEVLRLLPISDLRSQKLSTKFSPKLLAV